MIYEPPDGKPVGATNPHFDGERYKSNLMNIKPFPLISISFMTGLIQCKIQIYMNHTLHRTSGYLFEISTVFRTLYCFTDMHRSVSIMFY